MSSSRKRPSKSDLDGHVTDLLIPPTSSPSASSGKSTPWQTLVMPPLEQFRRRLPQVIESCSGANNLWGVTLRPDLENDAPTMVILSKFLKQEQGGIGRAAQRLMETILWYTVYVRQRELVDQPFPKKFDRIAYVCGHQRQVSGPNSENMDAPRIAVIWYRWENFGHKTAFFSDSTGHFLAWRMALMQLAIEELQLGNVTKMPVYEEPDEYRIIQVHDFPNVKLSDIATGVIK
ncbi:hypothetical protein B0H66DRAFT_613195 [Apodospora peruviana]|uniref:Phosphatidylinositol transfer protein SFH5 n=1 Tax=Apodospora peruviana TaxID=516989 RepID=A0AAE0MFY5_9PEZI|nr:hypothetical protein B0H66DRAFT_613195 [Apodospora peruviana]